jgi:hypothetical protein
MEQTRPKTVVASLYCVLCYLACWRRDSCGGGGADKRHVRKHVSVTGQDSDVPCSEEEEDANRHHAPEILIPSHAPRAATCVLG